MNKFLTHGTDASASELIEFNFHSLSQLDHADALTVPDAHLLFSGDYARSGRDLIISDPSHRFVVPDYFSGDKRPALVSPEGAPFDARLVDALTGHAAYAQAGPPASAAKGISRYLKQVRGIDRPPSFYLGDGRSRQRCWSSDRRAELPNFTQ